jgi:polysaccharide export outer membrane protein
MRSCARQLIFAVIALSITATAPDFGEAFRDPPSANGAPQGNYQIGADDVLDIVVWNNTDMSRVVPVRPDGMISLPLLNDVQAAGLTAMQVRDILVSRLAEFMATPEVSVIVKEVKSAKVTVIGQVKTPGRYDIKGRSTVMDILALAGPFTDFASLGRIFVLRPSGSTTKRLSFDYNEAVSRRGKQENFVLEPGDIIVVP